MLSALVVVALSQTPSNDLLGGPGESCRARSDCQAGLKCVNTVCTAPVVSTKEGQACEATSECSADGSLRCIAKLCSKRGATPVVTAPVLEAAAPPPPPLLPARSEAPPLPPAAEAPSSEVAATFEPERTSAFESRNFFIGLQLSGGVLTAVPSVSPAVRFGWFFAKTQLSFEVGPQLYVPFTGSLSLRGSLGFSVPFVDTGDLAFFWSPKAGLTALLGGVSGVGAHADVVSFALRTGHWLFDLQLPSVGVVFATFGLSIPIEGRLSVAYLF